MSGAAAAFGLAVTRPSSCSDIGAPTAMTVGLPVQTGDSSHAISSLFVAPNEFTASISSISVLGDLSISEEWLSRFGRFVRALDLEMSEQGDEESAGVIRVDGGEISAPSPTEWTPHRRPVRLLLSHRIDEVTSQK